MKEQEYLEELVQAYPDLKVCREDIRKAYEILKKSYEKNGKLLTCGNGGSGADAEHIVGELMKEFYIRRPLTTDMREKLKDAGDEGILAMHLQGSLPAITLTSNIALSTAFSNDAVPELVFAQQVMGYGNDTDVLLGISTSGNSNNVIYAIRTAKAKGMQVIGLTGEGGGKMDKLCDVCIKVPRTETYQVQELHLPVYHCLCRMIEEVFFG